MSRLLMVTLVLLVSGCAFSTSPPRSIGWSTHDVGGGRYTIEIEGLQPTQSSSTSFNFQDSGDKKEKETFNLIVDGTNVRIEMGQLTVNGTPRGELTKGDKIKVHGDGRVTVNDAER